MTITAGVENVTPERAKKWLQTMVTNRKLNPGVVAFYLNEMHSGQWQLNGESIKFDTDGHLIDGQHRLAALIRFNRPLPMLVVRNLASDSFSTLDTGKRRSGADVLHITQEKNATTLSSAARWLCILNGGDSWRAQISVPSLLDAIEKFPSVRSWVSLYSSSKKARSVMPGPAMAVFTLVALKQGDEMCKLFFDQIADGIGLTKNDPAYEFRERLVANKGSVAKLNQRVIIALLIKAFNAFVLNKKIGVLRWREDEEFPKIV